MADHVSLEEGYGALRVAAGAIALERDVVRVAGPGAAAYLQGQTSQDLVVLAPGASAWALVLSPQGKLDALVRACRAGEDEFLLVTDGGVGAALAARLDRFKLRTRAEVELLAWAGVSVLGPAAGEALGGSQAGCQIVSFAWGGLEGYELLGPAPEPPAGAVPVSREVYEAARVEAGFPRHGSELDDRTIPAEAGLVEPCVSFTKGCYTGQELVARIASRGSNVARRLRGLLLSGPAMPGDDLVAGAKAAGRLTSVSLSPRLGWVGLGYVARGVEPGEELAVKGTRPAGAAVRELPMLRPRGPGADHQP